jgi:uncharacterized membrane protein YvbJ
MKCPACGHEVTKLGEKCPNCGTFVPDPYQINFHELINNIKMDSWKELISLIILTISLIIYIVVFG